MTAIRAAAHEAGRIAQLTELAPAAGAYRGSLVSLIGQAASLTGVILMLDEGDSAAARHYLTVAAKAAMQAGDDELMAVTLGCRAFSAAYGGDTPAGLSSLRRRRDSRWRATSIP